MDLAGHHNVAAIVRHGVNCVDQFSQGAVLAAEVLQVINDEQVDAADRRLENLHPPVADRRLVAVGELLGVQARHPLRSGGRLAGKRVEQVRLPHSRRAVDHYRADRQVVAFQQPRARVVGDLVAFPRDVPFEGECAVHSAHHRRHGRRASLAACAHRLREGRRNAAPRHELNLHFAAQLAPCDARHHGPQFDVQPLAAKRGARFDDEPAAFELQRPRAPKPCVKAVGGEFHL